MTLYMSMTSIDHRADPLAAGS